MKIISGGQTGADQAGWRAAKAYGIKTGGWMPKGFMTEIGPAPATGITHGAVECASDSYIDQTNAKYLGRQSHAHLRVEGRLDLPGTKAVIAELNATGKLFKVIDRAVRFWPPACAEWIMANDLHKKNDQHRWQPRV